MLSNLKTYYSTAFIASLVAGIKQIKKMLHVSSIDVLPESKNITELNNNISKKLLENPTKTTIVSSYSLLSALSVLDAGRRKVDIS